MKAFAPKFVFPAALASLAFAIAYLYFYYAGLPLLADPDVAWHIAAGDLIRTSASLPATDPWSYTADGQPWYIISWLWDLVLSIVHYAFGTQGTFCFTLAVAALSVALLAGNLRARPQIGTDAIILVLFLIGISLTEFVTARPQLASYAFVLLFHRLLHASRNHWSPKIYWLPVIMVAWVNIHGSFLAGFTLIGAYGLEALILKRWVWFKQLFTIGLWCVFAALINPYGFGMYAAVNRTLDSVITPYIYEWLPFVFSSNLGISAWFLLFLLASGLREKSIPIADKILSLAWWLAMLFSMRNSSMFLLVSAPYVAMSLQKWVEDLDAIRTHRGDLGDMLNKAGMQTKMFSVAVVAVIASYFLLPVLKGESYLVPEKNPRAAIAHAQQHFKNKRILTDYMMSGRVIYFTGGTFPVFVDGRAGTAYSEEVLADYIRFMNLDEGWQQIVAKYRIDGLMVNDEHRFAKAFKNGQYRDSWKRVYDDGVASIFVKK